MAPDYRYITAAQLAACRCDYCDGNNGTAELVAVANVGLSGRDQVLINASWSSGTQMVHAFPRDTEGMALAASWLATRPATWFHDGSPVTTESLLALLTADDVAENREVTSMITIQGEAPDSRGTLNITPCIEDRQAIVFVQVDGQSAAWRMAPDALFSLVCGAKDALEFMGKSEVKREIPALDGFGGEGTLQIIVSPDLDEFGAVAPMAIMFSQRVCVSWNVAREQLPALRDAAYTAFAALTDSDDEE